MLSNAKGLEDYFRVPQKSPVMAMLDPKMSLVGSIPEGTRAGEIQEIFVMLKLASFQPCFLAPADSASTLKLTTPGRMYFCKFKKNYSLMQ